MAETFDLAIQQRAHNAAMKLSPNQVEHLNTLIGCNRGIVMEEAYQSLTGTLLEPVIARYWIANNGVVIDPWYNSR